MIDLEDYMAALEAWHDEVRLTCQDPYFFAIVAANWFEIIAPVKAEEYGIECWQRFGARGLVAQIFNCYCRWRRLEDKQPWSARAIYDTFRDLFGYAIMMGVVVDADPCGLPWDEIWTRSDPGIWYNLLIKQTWEEDKGDEHTAIQALCLAASCWNKTNERIHA